MSVDFTAPASAAASGENIPEEIDLSQRGVLEKKIVGALRSAIAAHGDITTKNISSAAKRVIGAIKQHNQEIRERRKGTETER